MKVAVVIPCFRVKQHILGVVSGVGPECSAIYVVDDRCPERTGDHLEAACQDPRLRVLRHQENQGVGGATLTGYRAALADGADVIVKLDGDGQMDPSMIPRLVRPILAGDADYTKGNRFFDLAGLKSMPAIRLVGNAGLSFASKLSSGYWNIFDPTNGFTALHAAVCETLPLDRIDRRWFFESDMLFRLSTVRAVVMDVPMPAFYEHEQSSLRVRHVVLNFAWKHLLNTAKRIFYGYYLRNFNIASIELVGGIAALAFGGWIGVSRWLETYRNGVPTTSGTVMLAALPILLGFQLILAFLSYDLQNVPRDVLHARLDGKPRPHPAPVGRGH